MELRRLFQILRHRALLIVAMVVAALAAGYAVTPQGAVYKATSTLFVGVAQPQSALYFNASLQTAQADLAYSFAPMISEPTVVEGASVAAGLPRSAGQLSAEAKSVVGVGTNLIYLTVTDPDPVVAQQAANAISQQFVKQIEKIQPVAAGSVSGTNGGPVVSPVSVFQPALLPVLPVPNKLRSNLILSGVFGFVIAVGLVMLLDYLDLSVRSPEDLEKRAGLPVLGVIPRLPELAATPSGSFATSELVTAGRGHRA
jgi:capsular polysaccharide biosynthesis protein